MSLYAGQKKYNEISASVIDVKGSNFLDGMTRLKGCAETQQQLGNHYMRAKTVARKEVIVDGNERSGHAENIDINALLALDLNNMEAGKAYSIGDRNGISSNMSCDIPRLVIRKVDNTPTYEFGILGHGSKFEKVNVELFEVYTTDIQPFPSNTTTP
jgi:hypothetical protein